MKPQIMAHRGDPAHAPENTVAAFRHALAIGADWLEMDVRRTRDGHLVIMHDAAVDRTTDGSGPISALTLDEVRRLDAGSWFAPEFRGERVPMLAEALDAIGRAAPFAVEIKEPPGTIEAEVLAALEAAGQLDRAVVTCFSPDALRQVKALRPEMPVGLLGIRPDPIAAALSVGAAWISPRKDQCTPEIVQAGHEAGLRVATWVIDDPAELPPFIAMGVDRVTSNDPARIVRALREMG